MPLSITHESLDRLKLLVEPYPVPLLVERVTVESRLLNGSKKIKSSIIGLFFYFFLLWLLPSIRGKDFEATAELALAVIDGCNYCINSHTAGAQKQGMDDEMLGEVLAVVGLYNQMNNLSDAYQIEPDILPEAARK